MRIQSAGETVHEYVTELRMLVRDCEFSMLKKEQIATQLVVGCLNCDAKKQLLQKAELDLDAFVSLVHLVESSEHDMSLLDAATRSVSVHKLSKGTTSQNKKAHKASKNAAIVVSSTISGKHATLTGPLTNR